MRRMRSYAADPVGIPCMYFGVLWQKRHILNPVHPKTQEEYVDWKDAIEARDEHEAEISHLSFLYGPCACPSACASPSAPPRAVLDQPGPVAVRTDAADHGMRVPLLLYPSCLFVCALLHRASERRR